MMYTKYSYSFMQRSDSYSFVILSEIVMRETHDNAVEGPRLSRFQHG